MFAARNVRTRDLTVIELLSCSFALLGFRGGCDFVRREQEAGLGTPLLYFYVDFLGQRRAEILLFVTRFPSTRS